MADALTKMQGNAEGYGKGLTTFPASTDPEQVATHAECLKLEKDGKVRRHLDHDGAGHPSGQPFVIWMPVDAAAVPSKVDDEAERP